MESRTVDTGFEYENKSYWFVAEVYYERSYTPAKLHPIESSYPEESLFEVSEVVIDEVTETVIEGGSINEIPLKVQLLDVELREAIEKEAIEQAERG